MRLLVVSVCVLLAGCTTEPDLLPCGDLVCPPSTTCLGDRCVTPAQLASCVDKAPDEPCAVDARVGVCVGGACTYVGCGNGVVDPGETCDDANTTFGDGCAADCRSLETCGNGITDYAVGETCDCGSDASMKPEQCASVNSDDPTTECSRGCELRFCGDDELNTLEQCDGTLVGDAVCRDFGYYHGAPTCSAGCLLEVGGCYGRCGDGDIEPAFGEFCDGAAPPGSCVSFGFDAGLPACSAACSPDFSRCERFGLVQHETRSVIAFEIWKGVPLMLGSAADGGTNAWAVINGVRVFAPEGNYVALVNDGTRVIAVAGDHLAVWNQTAWVVEAVGWPATASTPTSAAASAELGLFVAIDGALWHRTTVWTAEPLSAITGVSVLRDNVVAWSTTQAWGRSSASSYSSLSLPALTTSSLKFVFPLASGKRWVVTQQGASTTVHNSEGGPWRTLFANVRGASLDANGDLLVASASGAVLVRSKAYLSQDLLAFTPNVNTIVPLEDGGLALAATGGGLSLRTVAWQDYDLILAGFAYPPYESDRLEWLDVTSTGTAVGGALGNYAIWVTDIASVYFSPWEFYAGYPEDVSMLSDGRPILLTTGTVIDSSGNDVYIADRYDDLGNPTGYFPALHLDATRTGNVLATGNEVIARLGGTTTEAIYFDQTLPGITFSTADEATDGTIVALGFDGQHRIVRVAPDGTPTVLATGTALNDIWVSSTGDAIAVGGTTVMRCLASATTCTSETVGMLAYSVGATSVDDVFIGGTGASGVFGAISHWDGSRWFAVRAPTGYVSQLVVQDTHLIYVDGGTGVRHLERIARW